MSPRKEDPKNPRGHPPDASLDHGVAQLRRRAEQMARPEPVIDSALQWCQEHCRPLSARRFWNMLQHRLRQWERTRLLRLYRRVEPHLIASMPIRESTHRVQDYDTARKPGQRRPEADLHYAFRQLRKTPGFALAAVLVLALGVGANTAIFSFVSAFLLRPLPIDRPDETVLISGLEGATFSYSEYLTVPADKDDSSRIRNTKTSAA